MARLRAEVHHSFIDYPVELAKVKAYIKTLRPFNDTQVSTETDTVPNDYEEPIVLSALGEDGKIMSMDEYCEYHGLPRKDISSYKLVTHTGTPFYNTAFREIDSIEEASIDFNAIVSKHINKPVQVAKTTNKGIFDCSRVVYSDTHIGMKIKEHSLYGGTWGKDEITDRVNLMVEFILKRSDSSVLVVDDLGDLVDGQDGQTTRGGHLLPQNMTNEECFDFALGFKVGLADRLVSHFDTVIFNNVTNDNHGGSMGYYVNSAAAAILNQKYESVQYNIIEKFMHHYFIGEHCFIIAHGKDRDDMMRPFKVHASNVNIEQIDQYCKANDIYNKARFISFEKGDSHQKLEDFCSSDSFDYINHLAFSPASGWVQANFKKGHSGFVVYNFNHSEKGKQSNPYFF